jgi:putative methionine-R-sulfoxide reductase with GAF domain
MLSFPIADKQELFGVINVNSTTMKTFSEDEIYFISIIANLILSAVKFRKRFAISERGAA